MHQIYKETYYIPNDKVRILEIPVNSSLNFQMLLYYHGYYNFLFAFIQIPCGFYQVFVGPKSGMNIIIKFIMTLFFCFTEIFRLNFGYKGNINESYPELIAFMIQTLLFSLAFVIVPFSIQVKFPHENCMYILSIIFLFCEFILGIFLCMKFSNTMTAAYYRRTAPILDKKFKKKYDNAIQSNNPRAIPLGMKRLKKIEDRQHPLFADSNAQLKVQTKKGVLERFQQVQFSETLLLVKMERQAE